MYETNVHTGNMMQYIYDKILNLTGRIKISQFILAFCYPSASFIKGNDVTGLVGCSSPQNNIGRSMWERQWRPSSSLRIILSCHVWMVSQMPLQCQSGPESNILMMIPCRGCCTQMLCAMGDVEAQLHLQCLSSLCLNFQYLKQNTHQQNVSHVNFLLVVAMVLLL